MRKEIFKQSDIIEINLNEDSNFLPYRQIDIGISTLHNLRKAKASETDNMLFRKDCRHFLLNCVKKTKGMSTVNL